MDVESRGKLVIGTVLSAVFVVILAFGIVHFKVSQPVAPNYATVRAAADKALAKTLYESQANNDTSSAVLVSALASHYNRLVRAYSSARSVHSKTDAVFLLNLMTTTGDSRQSSAPAWQCVLYFLPAIFLLAYCYSMVATAMHDFAKRFFEATPDRSFTISYDPMVSVQDGSTQNDAPAACKEKIKTGAAAELSPLLAHVGLIGSLPHDDAAPSILFFLILSVYIVLSSALITAYKEMEYFTAFVSFVRCVAMIEPISTNPTIGGYLVLVVCYAGQIIFVATLIEQTRCLQMLFRFSLKAPPQVRWPWLTFHSQDPMPIDDAAISNAMS